MPTMNDLVLAWLSAANIVPAPNSFIIEIDGQTGVSAIAYWDVGLSTQPTTDQLNALSDTVTIRQTAQDDYDTRIGSGIAITSTATPALNATYALDPLTVTDIQALANDCAVGFGFPGGTETFVFPDQSSAPHTFASADMVNLYKAIRTLVFQMQETLAARLQGDDASWPDQSATIA